MIGTLTTKVKKIVFCKFMIFVARVNTVLTNY